MKFTILHEAELEAAEAAAWYDDQRSGLGDDFLADLATAFDAIERAPQDFSRLETYCGSRDVRRRLLDRFPYLVAYLCGPEETLVVAIPHVRRRPLYWMERCS